MRKCRTNQEFKLKQFSSYNRKTTGIGEEGWYENSDMSHFIRVEETEGRREFVMFDHDGQGAIVRTVETTAGVKTQKTSFVCCK